MSKIGFLFPGQGAQVVGMGQELAENFAPAKALFDQAANILGYDLAEVCFQGPTEKLNATSFSQPGLFVTSLAALKKLEHDHPEVIQNCVACAGLSLGEYSALTFAGAFEFETALKIVQIRGKAMQAAADLKPSGMVSILGLKPEEVLALCEAAREPGEILQPANYLCPGNIAISGHQSACERATALAGEHGAMKAIPLAVAGAFHTSLMDSAVEKLTAALKDAEIKPPSIPVLFNVDAKTHEDPEEIRKLLTKQVNSPVLWENSLQNLLEQGVEQFYEVGPGRVLKGLLKRINRKVPCESTMG